jgi:hypothetical protein
VSTSVDLLTASIVAPRRSPEEADGDATLASEGHVGVRVRLHEIGELGRCAHERRDLIAQPGEQRAERLDQAGLRSSGSKTMLPRR